MNSNNKTAAISAMILVKVAEGMTIRQAIDAVCGVGSAAAAIDAVWQAAQVKR